MPRRNPNLPSTRWRSFLAQAVRGRVVGGLLLLVLCIYLFAEGDSLVGSFVAAFVVIAWLPTSYSRITNRLSRRPATSNGDPLLGFAFKAGAATLLALALGICQLAGLGLRRDTTRGVVGIAAFFAGLYLVARLLSDRRGKARDDREPRP
jgi:hypothetical protein